MGFLSVPFQSLNNHWLVLLEISLQLDREGIKEREDGERVGSGGGGAIIEGRWLFQIFPSKGGDFLREVIIWGTAIIQGNTVCLRWDSNSLLLIVQ